MLVRLVLIMLTFGLAACNATNEAANDLARSGAKKAVNQVLFTKFPNVDSGNVTPYTDCVIESATALEINALARDAVLGVDADTVRVVTNITKRPETATCIARAGLAQTLST
jgi:hypothetical protein